MVNLVRMLAAIAVAAAFRLHPGLLAIVGGRATASGGTALPYAHAALAQW